MWPTLIPFACVTQPPHHTTAWTDPVVEALREGLPGAQIDEGRMFWLHQEDCGPIVEATGTCFSAHPGSPYGLFDFSGAAVDAAVEEVPNAPMDQHEAWVFVGHLPPTGVYWSFNVYQYRKALFEGHAVTFGSVAPSLNLLQMEEARGASFGDFAVIIFTASPSTGEWLTTRLTPILEGAGVPADALWVHPIAYRTPDEVQAMIDSGERTEEELFSLTMGRDEAADTYAMALRVADIDPAAAYVNPATVPATAFRITPDEGGTNERFPWPDLPPAATTGEVQPERLAAARDQVVAWLAERFRSDGLAVVETAMVRRPRKTSAGCVNLEVTCGANNDDAQYIRSQARFVIADDTSPASVVAVGINHRWVGTHFPEAPPVTYSSLTLNNLTRGYGVVTQFGHETQGSLAAWLGDDPPADFLLEPHEYDALYVTQFARSCEDAFCRRFRAADVGIRFTDRIWFTERVYLNKTTKTAPAHTAIIAPRLLGVGPQLTSLSGGGWLLTPPE